MLTYRFLFGRDDNNKDYGLVVLLEINYFVFNILPPTIPKMPVSNQFLRVVFEQALPS